MVYLITIKDQLWMGGQFKKKEVNNHKIITNYQQKTQEQNQIYQQTRFAKCTMYI